MEHRRRTQDPFKGIVDHSLGGLTQVLEQFHPELQAREVGTVVAVGQGIARVQGLTRVKAEELVKFPGNLLGMVFNLDLDEVGVILLDENQKLQAGLEVRPTKRILDVPVGEALLGRVVDPLGRPLDGREPVRRTERWPVER